MATKRKAMDNLLEEMDDVLGEDQSIRKRVKTSVPEETENFEYEKDHFEIATNSPNIIAEIVNVMKQDECGSIKITPNGMEFFCINNSKTVGIRSSVSKEVFGEKYTCSSIVHTSVNFMTLAKYVSNILNFKPSTITIKSENGDLKIQGKKNGRVCVDYKIKCLADDVEEPDFDSLEYDSPITLSKSSDLARAIKCMPSDFKLSFDSKNECIRMKGEDTSGNVDIPIYLDNKELVTELSNTDEVKNYSESFSKSNLDALVKGTKLSDQVTLGMKEDACLFARFQITDAIEKCEEGSKIDMFFSPSISQDM